MERGLRFLAPRVRIARPLSVLLAALTLGCSLFPATPSLAQPQFLAGDDDALWSAFVARRCSAFIEDVPIVAKSEAVTPLSVALSTVIGHYERSFPILGPPIPQRVPRLVNTSLTALGLAHDAATTNTVAKVWYDVEARSSARFFDASQRLSKPATEGMIRSYAVQRSDLGRIEQLQSLARERFQEVKINRFSPVTPDVVEASLRTKAPAVILIDGGKLAYVLVGLYESRAIVIDSDSARPLAMPAEQVLLTEQDRESSGDFSTSARERLKGQISLVDQTTSCSERRSPGVRFAKPDVLGVRAELYMIQWSTDVPALRQYMTR